MSLLVTSILIIIIRIIDVSLGTVRMVLTVRGKRGLGSLIGFIEVLIWFLVVRRALTIEDAGIIVAVAYAGGFSIGTYMGVMLEEKLAIGNASIQVITKGIREDLVAALRSNGFAVSSVITQGKDKENLLLLIEINRKKSQQAMSIINEVAPDSFVRISDIKRIVGGYFPNKVRR